MAPAVCVRLPHIHFKMHPYIYIHTYLLVSNSNISLSNTDIESVRCERLAAAAAAVVCKWDVIDAILNVEGVLLLVLLPVLLLGWRFQKHCSHHRRSNTCKTCLLGGHNHHRHKNKQNIIIYVIRKEKKRNTKKKKKKKRKPITIISFKIQKETKGKKKKETIYFF